MGAADSAHWLAAGKPSTLIGRRIRTPRADWLLEGPEAGGDSGRRIGRAEKEKHCYSATACTAP